jgi:hypothetical protein
MSSQSIFRWGGLASILAAALFAAGGLLTLLPAGGMDSPAAPILYYLGLVLVVPALTSVYAAQSQTAGKLGFAGFLLAILGSMLYSAPAYVLVAGTAGVQEWHSVWLFSMSNVLSLGGSAFLIGMAILGVATMRSSTLPRGAGLLVVAGSLLWFVAFWGSMAMSPVITFVLTAGNLLLGIGLAWIGSVLWTRPAQARGSVSVQPTP